MELTTITRRVGELYGVDVSAIEPDPNFAGAAGWKTRNGEQGEAPEPAAEVRAGAGAEARRDPGDDAGRSRPGRGRPRPRRRSTGPPTRP